MKKDEKVANIIAFLFIIFHENDVNGNCIQLIMEISPDYLIEKFERYVLSSREEHQWGMHPFLKKNLFDKYANKWDLDIDDEARHRDKFRKMIIKDNK